MIYFSIDYEAPGLVKITTTRQDTLSTVKSIEGDEELEKAIKIVFSNYHHIGSWYLYNGLFGDYVDNIHKVLKNSCIKITDKLDNTMIDVYDSISKASKGIQISRQTVYNYLNGKINNENYEITRISIPAYLRIKQEMAKYGQNTL